MLLDSGATKNFINMQYIKELRLPIKWLQWPWLVYNVDGTRNKNKDIKCYTDLEMQTGDQRVWLQFFLTDLADQEAILGTHGLLPHNQRLTGHEDRLIVANSHSSCASEKPQNHK